MMTRKDLAEIFRLSDSQCNSHYILLFLNVLTRHIGGVVEKSHVPLHHLLAVLTRKDALFTIDLFLCKLSLAESLAGDNVEELLWLTIFLVQDDLLSGTRERGKLRVAAASIHISHFKSSIDAIEVCATSLF